MSLKPKILACQKSNTETSANKEKIARCEKRRDEIERNRTGAIRQRKSTNEQKLADIARRKAELITAEQSERQKRLADLQNGFIKDGLKAALISSANIKGVGPKTKEKLIANGIKSAADVRANRILDTPGFGESMAQTLINWRDFEQAALQKSPSMPRMLPAADDQRISEKYRKLLSGIEDLKKQEQTALPNDLQVIELDAKNKQAENDKAMQTAIESITWLTKKREAVNGDYVRYTKITPGNFVATLIWAGREPVRPLMMIGALGAGIFTVSCVGTLSMISGVRSVIALIPTQTATATATATPTNTATSTLTLTPTLTFTPTITLTPTETFTPTITFTPTMTFTPTKTRTPTPTKTATRLPTFTPGPKPTQSGNCHPSYPTVCIPPPPPDLDCGDISFKRFKVLPPDPHGFDRDGDGIGCES